MNRQTVVDTSFHESTQFYRTNALVYIKVAITSPNAFLPFLPVFIMCQARTEATMAKRREQRAAQNAKMSAMGFHLPSAEEVANRKLRVMAERRVKAVLVLQCCVRGNSARQTFQVRRRDADAFVNEGNEEDSAPLTAAAAVLL